MQAIPRRGFPQGFACCPVCLDDRTQPWATVEVLVDCLVAITGLLGLQYTWQSSVGRRPVSWLRTRNARDHLPGCTVVRILPTPLRQLLRSDSPTSDRRRADRPIARGPVQRDASNIESKHQQEDRDDLPYCPRERDERHGLQHLSRVGVIRPRGVGIFRPVGGVPKCISKHSFEGAILQR